MKVKQKLKSLFDSKKGIDYEGLEVNFFQNIGIKAELIENYPLINNLKLPDEYLDFLQLCDGCELFKYEELGGFWFMGTSEIQSENRIAKETYSEFWTDDLIVFCESIVDGDYLAFKIISENEYHILDGYHDDVPNNWKIIGESFYEVLEKIIDSKGKRFWLES